MQQALVEAVATVAKKLVIVVVSAGGVDLDGRLANAVVWAPYGGEEAGSGLADVLWGVVNPSARLPVVSCAVCCNAPVVAGWMHLMLRL